MLENATPLPVKAAGGVRTYDEAVEMIKLGEANRDLWGKAIANEGNTGIGYTIKKQYEKSLFALVLSFFSFFSYSQDRFIRVKYFSRTFSCFSAL
jgi:hypothetical protein